MHMNVKGSLSERNCVITHLSVSLSLSLINTEVLIWVGRLMRGMELKQLPHPVCQGQITYHSSTGKYVFLLVLWKARSGCILSSCTPVQVLVSTLWIRQSHGSNSDMWMWFAETPVWGRKGIEATFNVELVPDWLSISEFALGFHT